MAQSTQFPPHELSELQGTISQSNAEINSALQSEMHCCTCRQNWSQSRRNFISSKAHCFCLPYLHWISHTSVKFQDSAVHFERPFWALGADSWPRAILWEVLVFTSSVLVPVVDDDLYNGSWGLLGVWEDSTVTPGTGESWNVHNLPGRAGWQVIVGAMVWVSLFGDRKKAGEEMSHSSEQGLWVGNEHC